MKRHKTEEWRREHEQESEMGNETSQPYDGDSRQAAHSHSLLQKKSSQLVFQGSVLSVPLLSSS